MKRTALLGMLSLSVAVSSTPSYGAGCPKSAYSWLMKDGTVKPNGDEILAGYNTKNAKICDEITKEYTKLGGTDASGNVALLGDGDEAKTFRAKIGKEAAAAPKPQSTTTTKTTKTVKTDATAVIAQPVAPDNSAQAGDDADFNPKNTSAKPPCIDCQKGNTDQQPLPQEQVNNIRDVANNIPDVNEGPVHPQSTFNTSNLWWGIGGALVGGLLGYAIGKNHATQPDYSSMYAGYYGGWNGSGYYPSPYGFGYGGLPGAYRAPGTFGMGAPMFAPYPGPGGGYLGPGGFMGAGGGFQPINGSLYGGVSPLAYSSFNSGYNGFGGSNLCTNCVLPTMYPAPH